MGFRRYEVRCPEEGSSAQVRSRKNQETSVAAPECQTDSDVVWACPKTAGLPIHKDADVCDPDSQKQCGLERLVVSPNSVGSPDYDLPFPRAPGVSRTRNREGLVDVRCNAGHQWMSAEILVATHPHYAVTMAEKYFWRSGWEKCFSLDIPYFIGPTENTWNISGAPRCLYPTEPHAPAVGATAYFAGLHRLRHHSADHLGKECEYVWRGLPLSLLYCWRSI